MEKNRNNDPIIKKILLSLLFSYLVITILPYPSVIVDFFAELFFNFKLSENEMTGSGDSTFHYYQQFASFVLTLPLAAGIFSLVAIKKWWTGFRKIFLILLRYYLLGVMFTYGFAKIFNQQFGPPSLFTLDKPVGMMSPMNLAWTFMGYSKAYTIFTGFAEVIGGALLLFRRTTLLGAIICFAVMLNVMVMNYCYDIPVKIFSTNLVFWTIVLMLSEHRRLLALLFSSNFQGTEIYPYFRKKWENVLVYVFKGFVILFLAGGVVMMGLSTGEEESEPLRGIYRAQRFARNHDTAWCCPNDTSFWTKLIIEHGTAVAYNKDNKKLKLTIKADTSKKTLVLLTEALSDHKPNFKYALKDSTLILDGILNQDTIHATFKQFNHHRYLLLSRGFNWINEFPFNR